MKDDRREGIDIHEEAAILVGVILPGTVTEDGDPLRDTFTFKLFGHALYRL